MCEVNKLACLDLSYEDGPQEMVVKVQVFTDGEIELILIARTVTGDEPPEIESDEFDTQFMPAAIGIALRDFLNYAYPVTQYPPRNNDHAQ